MSDQETFGIDLDREVSATLPAKKESYPFGISHRVALKVRNEHSRRVKPPWNPPGIP
jgi:hypothetical protein